MRLLLVNPNMTEAMTRDMTAIARAVAGSAAEVVPLTAPRGFPYIASRAEAQVAGGIALEMIAENLAGTDAVIMAAFGDPGLRGARELFDLPVVGMAEAAMMSACMLGERFSIVTFSPVMRRWYLDCVADSGLMGRCTGVRTPPGHPLRIDGLREQLKDDLARLARQAVEEDGADVVILGGAPLAGLAPEIARLVPGLVLDPIAAATAQAMALAQITTRAGFALRACKPLAKPSVGLGPALGTIIARDTRT
ncbi:MAG: aspartate/glutamate racemase family protein [Pararhodobacter sp.]|nr:aspartate/glutamate racemase family protein [Pararhodobacter sp.]